jgi:hypothetical protein
MARFDKLTPGTRVYLRYTVSNGKRSAIDLWQRKVSFEQVNGKTLMHIAQQWDADGKNNCTVIQDAWFEPGSFIPLTQERHVTKEGQSTYRAYRFYADHVEGMADKADNKDKDFKKALPEPAYNFETDIEFFQTLPLAAGYEAKISFYDAGLDEPGWYSFKVIGEDSIAGPDGKPVDCWVMSTDYNHPGEYLTKFWFSKQSQVMMREQSWGPDGAMLVKTLLNGEAAKDG